MSRASFFALLMMTGLCILAFAGNSLLARAALAAGQMDALTFTAVRVISGAFALAVLAALRCRGGFRRWGGEVLPGKADVLGVVALGLYMAGFSAAYGGIDAASGALILFAIVQVVVLGWGMVRGQRPTGLQCGGVVLALAGLVYLLAPSARVQALWPVCWMVAAGVGWGAYTLLGRSAGDPLARTTRNFIGAVPLGLVLLLLGSPGGSTASAYGLAIVSGAVTSGLGYALWYRTVPRLSVTASGVSQLLVPPVTALLAVALLAEPVSWRLGVASAVTLAGVGLAIRGGTRQRPSEDSR